MGRKRGLFGGRHSSRPAALSLCNRAGSRPVLRAPFDSRCDRRRNPATEPAGTPPAHRRRARPDARGRAGARRFTLRAQPTIVKSRMRHLRVRGAHGAWRSLAAGDAAESAAPARERSAGTERERFDALIQLLDAFRIQTERGVWEAAVDEAQRPCRRAGPTTIASTPCCTLASHSNRLPRARRQRAARDLLDMLALSPAERGPGRPTHARPFGTRPPRHASGTPARWSPPVGVGDRICTGVGTRYPGDLPRDVDAHAAAPRRIGTRRARARTRERDRAHRCGSGNARRSDNGRARAGPRPRGRTGVSQRRRRPPRFGRKDRQYLRRRALAGRPRAERPYARTGGRSASPLRRSARAAREPPPPSELSFQHDQLGRAGARAREFRRGLRVVGSRAAARANALPRSRPSLA